MGGGSSSKSGSSSNTTYKNTTTTNPYVTSQTTDKGTTTTLQPNTALSSVYDFTNANIGNLLNEYLNPSMDTAVNKAKMNEFNKVQRQNLENNIISPLAGRNMIRSSQATDMYNNLNNQAADYANSLIANSQADTANIINNLMNYALQGYNVISGNQAQSLNTSMGNASKTSSGSSSSSSYGL